MYSLLYPKVGGYCTEVQMKCQSIHCSPRLGPWLQMTGASLHLECASVNMRHLIRCVTVYCNEINVKTCDAIRKICQLSMYKRSNGSAHDSAVLMASAHAPSLNAHIDVSSGATCICFVGFCFLFVFV